MKIDEKIMNSSGYQLTQKYLESTYGVELEAKAQPETNKPDEKKKE